MEETIHSRTLFAQLHYPQSVPDPPWLRGGRASRRVWQPRSTFRSWLRVWQGGWFRSHVVLGDQERLGPTEAHYYGFCIPHASCPRSSRARYSCDSLRDASPSTAHSGPAQQQQTAIKREVHRTARSRSWYCQERTDRTPDVFLRVITNYHPTVQQRCSRNKVDTGVAAGAVGAAAGVVAGAGLT